MVQTIRLQPHDPLPSPAEDHVLVVSRFATNNPNETVVEVSVNSPHLRAGPTPASRAPNGPKNLEQALDMARDLAKQQRIPRVYAVDRTAGDVEQKVQQRGRSLSGMELKDFNT